MVLRPYDNPDSGIYFKHRNDLAEQNTLITIL